MKVILTMTIKNGGSTVQMNSAEAYTKDVRVLIIIVGASGLIYSSISCQKKKKKMDYLETKVLRHNVFLS